MDAIKSRRAVLRAITAAMIPLVSGCAGIVQSLVGPSPDVVVFNNTDHDRRPKITIGDQSTGQTVVSETPTIPASEAAEYPDVLASTGRYTMSVELDDALTNSYEWSVSSDDQSMQVTITVDSITFREVSP